jgi:hypothetical protein
VEEGKLPQSALTALEEAAVTASSYHQGKFNSVPTTVINSRPASEVIFKYDGVAVPKMSASEAWARMGTTKVSFGRARWEADGASIFSVNDGKRLAQEPVRQPSAFELNRMRKVQNAAIDSRTLSGIRLMPEFTPGRAMLWGTILAIWGTAAAVTATARALDIHTKEEAPEKLEAVFTPIVSSMAGVFQPLKNWLHLHARDTTSQVNEGLLPVSELARQMRFKMASPRE